MTPADALEAARVHQAMDTPWGAAEWSGFLADTHVLGFGAIASGGGDTLAGAVLLRAVADECEILTVIVAPDSRRGGIGRALLSAALDKAVERGAKSAFLEVAVDNDAAISLYRDAGFVEIGRRRGYYRRAEEAHSGGAVDALVMRRELRKRG